MAIELTNQNGKKIAALPDPNQSDDAEKAKAAKGTLSASRKELKSVVSMQKDRLYEALCTSAHGGLKSGTHICASTRLSGASASG